MMYEGKVMRTPVNMDESLQITVPKITKKSLKIKAAESGDTMRLIVLRALANAGINVPENELYDRRKSK
jgi:hypothetical protein